MLLHDTFYAVNALGIVMAYFFLSLNKFKKTKQKHNDSLINLTMFLQYQKRKQLGWCCP